MPTLQSSIVGSLTISRNLLNAFVKELQPHEYLHRPCAGANCAAWIVGHLTLTERMALKRLNIPSEKLPTLPEGFEQRFARDEAAPKSELYGDTTVLLDLFNQHRDLLIGLAGSASAETLDIAIDHPRFKTVGDMMLFMSTHTALHTGQISTIRRSLGKPPVI